MKVVKTVKKFKIAGIPIIIVNGIPKVDIKVNKEKLKMVGIYNENV